MPTLLQFWTGHGRDVLTHAVVARCPFRGVLVSELQ